MADHDINQGPPDSSLSEGSGSRQAIRHIPAAATVFGVLFTAIAVAALFAPIPWPAKLALAGVALGFLFFLINWFARWASAAPPGSDPRYWEVLAKYGEVWGDSEHYRSVVDLRKLESIKDPLRPGDRSDRTGAKLARTRLATDQRSR